MKNYDLYTFLGAVLMGLAVLAISFALSCWAEKNGYEIHARYSVVPRFVNGKYTPIIVPIPQ